MYITCYFIIPLNIIITCTTAIAYTQLDQTTQHKHEGDELSIFFSKWRGKKKANLEL